MRCLRGPVLSVHIRGWDPGMSEIQNAKKTKQIRSISKNEMDGQPKIQTILKDDIDFSRNDEKQHTLFWF